MLLSKEKCTCNAEGCTCGKEIKNEGLENGKELLGSFNEKIPVLETNNHEYKVVKESVKKENLLFS